MAEAATDTISRPARWLDRAFEILEFLRVNRQRMRPNEISSETGAPRSSVYELVDLLLSHGMLDYQDGDGRVFLGQRLYFLGRCRAVRFDAECNRMLVRLAEETRETAQMCPYRHALPGCAQRIRSPTSSDLSRQSVECCQRHPKSWVSAQRRAQLRKLGHAGR
jgi:DNA-binding IclR family transcriptional regulator